jgi:hypothetical protein
MSIRVLVLRLLPFLLVPALFGCASSPLLDTASSERSQALADASTAAGAPSVSAPKHPNEPFAYPSPFEAKEVHRAALLNGEEYKKVRDDLVAARERVRANVTASAQDEKVKDDAIAIRKAAAGEHLTAATSN